MITHSEERLEECPCKESTPAGLSVYLTGAGFQYDTNAWRDSYETEALQDYPNDCLCSLGRGRYG